MNNLTLLVLDQMKDHLVVSDCLQHLLALENHQNLRDVDKFISLKMNSYQQVGRCLAFLNVLNVAVLGILG